MAANVGIVALDAATTTGYCVRLNGDVLLSGQCPLAKLSDHISPGFFTGPDWRLVVELPFVGPRQSPRSVISHAMNCGWAIAVAQHCFPDHSRLWKPLSTEWRRLLKDRGMVTSPATSAKQRALAIAREDGVACEGPKGGDLVDAAEAYCIALAAERYFAEGELRG